VLLEHFAAAGALLNAYTSSKMSHLRRRKPTTATENDNGDHRSHIVDRSSSCGGGSEGEGDVAQNIDANNTCKETNVSKETSTPVTATPAMLDRFLATYGSFSNLTFTADQGLKVLQWSTWAISYATQANKGSLSPGLRKLYGELSMTRYVLRFYGFFQSVEAYRSGSWAGGPWGNALIPKITKYLMAGSMLCYYPLEHVAYAGWKMPELVRVNANKVSAMSCVFWTAFIVGDFWASCLKLNEMKTSLVELRRSMAEERKNDEKETVDTFPPKENELLNKMSHIKLQIIRCLLFILPAINWSLPNWAINPLLGEVQLNGLMLAEAYTSVYQSLRSICG